MTARGRILGEKGGFGKDFPQERRKRQIKKKIKFDNGGNVGHTSGVVSKEVEHDLYRKDRKWPCGFFVFTLFFGFREGNRRGTVPTSPGCIVQVVHVGLVMRYYSLSERSTSNHG